MKINRIVALTLSMVGAASLALAQPPPGENGGPGRRLKQPGGEPGKPGPGLPGMEKLTPEEREKLHAAFEKVRAEADVKAAREKLEEARKEFQQTLREALLKADPSLEPILDKMREARMEGRGDRPGMKPGGPGGLSEDERAKLKAAREKAEADESVVAAKDKLKAANSPEEKRDAMREFREAMKAAMLKADPSIEPILKKGPKGPPPAE